MNYFNPIAGVVNLREKCHASCCRHLNHVCDYSEPYSMSCQAMVHLICNVQRQTKCCSGGKIAQVRKLHRRDNADQRKLGKNYFETAERNLELI